MHIRSFIAACALALASMLAFPAMALDASPSNALGFDQIGHEIIVAPTFGLAHVDTLDLAAIVSTSAADKAAGDCAEDFDKCLDVIFGTTSRRYDPGWLNG